jgi:hypothetical protein
MHLKYQSLTLDQLKAEKSAVEKRLALAKHNLSPKQQITSETVLTLVRQDVELSHRIACWTPHDFTPNPGGTSGTPVGALAHA